MLLVADSRGFDPTALTATASRGNCTELLEENSPVFNKHKSGFELSMMTLLVWLGHGDEVDLGNGLVGILDFVFEM